MDTIRLNDNELDLARKIAGLRYTNARILGKQNGKIGPQSNFMTDFSGMCGELAFCKMIGIYPNLDAKEPDVPYDYRVGMYTIDVKTTSYKTGCLLSRADKEYNGVDIYVLMIGSPLDGEYRFGGFASSDELRNQDNIGEKFQGRSYYMEQKDLAPLSDLIDILWE